MFFRSLDKRKLEYNELVENFSYRLSKSLNFFHPLIDDDALQILKYTFIINSMPKNILIRLLGEVINDFVVALSRAEQLQEIYKLTDPLTTSHFDTLDAYSLEQSNNSCSNSSESE